jgi:hypothetical protein
MPTINVSAAVGPNLRVYEAAPIVFVPAPASVSAIPDPAIPFDILGPTGSLLVPKPTAGRRRQTNNALAH